MPIAPIGGRNNWYDGKTRSGRIDRASTGAFTTANVGVIAIDADCVICSSTPLAIGHLVMGDAGPTTDAGKLTVFINGDSSVIIQITGNATGGGKYLAKLMQPGSADVSESGNLADGDIGTVYTPSDTSLKILALNLPERGLATHALPNNTVCRATIRRRQANGTMVVLIERDDYFDCT